MRCTVSRTIFGTSTYVVVEISPETTTRPVLTSVSHATRPFGSSLITASSTPSEIWSAILSGWPSVTDSEVNRNSLSEDSVMAWSGQLQFRGGRDSGIPQAGWQSRRSLRGPALAALDEVDDERHALHAVAGAQAVLQEVGVVTRHAGARVDLDGEARRALADLGHVEELQAVLAR